MFFSLFFTVFEKFISFSNDTKSIKKVDSNRFAFFQFTKHLREHLVTHGSVGVQCDNLLFGKTISQRSRSLKAFKSFVILTLNFS